MNSRLFMFASVSLPELPPRGVGALVDRLGESHRLAAALGGHLRGLHEREDLERLFRRERHDTRPEELHDVPEKRAEGESPIVVFSKSAEGYKPLVRQIARFFKTGVPPVSPDETLEVFAFMEAAEMSAKRGGEPVTIAEAIAASTDAPWWKFW